MTKIDQIETMILDIPTFRGHVLSFVTMRTQRAFPVKFRFSDAARDTHKCHGAIADPGAHAVMPPRKKAKQWKPSTAGGIARNEALRASRYPGRAIWRTWRGHHRRNRAETKPIGIMLRMTLPVSGCLA